MNLTKLLTAPASAKVDWRVRALRAAVGAACAMAPERMSRLAERWWFTPPRQHVSAAAAAFLDTAEPLSLVAGAARVTGYAWGRGPLVVAMHGWGSHVGRWRTPIDAFVAAGFRVLAFDAPSHGRSDPGEWGPRQANFNEMAAMLFAIVDTFGMPHALVAHSGGCTASALALRRGLKAGRVVWFAPMVRPGDYVSRYQQSLNLSNEVMLRWQTRAEHRLGFRWADLDIADLPRHVPAPPALVLHDRDDVETFADDSVDLVARWPGARLHLTQGLGHHGVLRDAATLRDVVAFLHDDFGVQENRHVAVSKATAASYQ